MSDSETEQEYDGAQEEALSRIRVQTTQTGLDPLISLTTAHETAFDGPCMYRIADLLKQSDEWDNVSSGYQRFWSYIVDTDRDSISTYGPLQKRCYIYSDGHRLHDPECDCRYCGCNWLALSLILKNKATIPGLIKSAMNTVYERIKVVLVSQLRMAFEKLKYTYLDREICKGMDELVTVISLLDVQPVFEIIYALTRDIANEILKKMSLLLKRTSGSETAKHLTNYFFEAVQRLHVVIKRLGVYFACFDWRFKQEGANLSFYTIIMHGFQHLVYDRPEVRLIFDECLQMSMKHNLSPSIRRQRRFTINKKYVELAKSMDILRNIWKNKKIPFAFKETKIPTYNVLKIASFRDPYYDMDELAGTTEVFEALYDQERQELEMVLSQEEPSADRFKGAPFMTLNVSNPLDTNKSCKIRVFREDRAIPHHVHMKGYLNSGNLAFVRAHGYEPDLLNGDRHWNAYEYFRRSRQLDEIEGKLPGGVSFLRALASVNTAERLPARKKSSRPGLTVSPKRYFESSLLRSAKTRLGTYIPFRYRDLCPEDESPVEDRRDFLYDRLVERPMDRRCRISRMKEFEFTHDLISSTFMAGINAIGVSNTNFLDYKYYIHLDHPSKSATAEEPQVPNVDLAEVMGIQYQFLEEFDLLEEIEKEKLCYINYLENETMSSLIKEFIQINSIGSYLREKAFIHSKSQMAEGVFSNLTTLKNAAIDAGYAEADDEESDEDNGSIPSPKKSQSPSRPLPPTNKIQNTKDEDGEKREEKRTCKGHQCGSSCRCKVKVTCAENKFLAESGLFHSHPLDSRTQMNLPEAPERKYGPGVKDCLCCQKMRKENLDEDQMDGLRTRAIKARYGGTELSKEQYNLFTRSQSKPPSSTPNASSSVTASPAESPEKKLNETRPYDPPAPRPAVSTINSKIKSGEETVGATTSGASTANTSPVKPSCSEAHKAPEPTKCKNGKEVKPGAEPCKSCPHSQPRNPNNAAYIEQKTRLRKKLQSNTEARPENFIEAVSTTRLSTAVTSIKIRNEIISITKGPKGPEKDVDDIVRDIEGIKISAAAQDPKKSAKKARQKEKKLEEVRLAEEMRLEEERRAEEERRREEERLRKEAEEEERKRRELEAQKKKKKKKNKKKQEEAEVSKAAPPCQINCQNGETVIKMRDTGKTIVVPKEPTTGEMLTIMKTLHEFSLSEKKPRTGMEAQGASGAKPITITKETFAQRAAEKGKSDMVTIRRHPTSDSTVTISVKDDNGKDDVIYTLVNGQVLSVPSGATPGSMVQKGAGSGSKDPPLTKKKGKKGKRAEKETGEAKEPPPPPAAVSTNGNKEGLTQRIKYNPGPNPVDIKGPSSSKSFELFNSFESHREEPFVNVNSLRLPPGITITKIVDQSQNPPHRMDLSSSLAAKQVKPKKTFDENVIVVDGTSPNSYAEDEIFGLPYEGEEFEEVVSTKTRRLRNKTKDLDVDHPRVGHTVGRGKTFTTIPGFTTRFRGPAPFGPVLHAAPVVHNLPAPGFRYPPPSRMDSMVFTNSKIRPAVRAGAPSPFPHHQGKYEGSRYQSLQNSIMPRLNGRKFSEFNSDSLAAAAGLCGPHSHEPKTKNDVKNDVNLETRKSESPVLSYTSPQFGLSNQIHQAALHSNHPDAQYPLGAIHRRNRSEMAVMELLNSAADKDLTITTLSQPFDPHPPQNQERVSFDKGPIGAERMRTPGEELPGFARPESNRSNSASSDLGPVYEMGHQSPFKPIRDKNFNDGVQRNPAKPVPIGSGPTLEETITRARRYSSNNDPIPNGGPFFESDAKMNYGPIGSRPNSTQRDQMLMTSQSSVDPYDMNFMTMNGSNNMYGRPVPKSSPSPTPIGNERAFLKKGFTQQPTPPAEFMKKPETGFYQYQCGAGSQPLALSQEIDRTLGIEAGRQYYPDGKAESPIDSIPPERVRDLRELFAKSGLGALNPSSREFTGYKMFEGFQHPLSAGVSLENETWRYNLDEEKSSNGWAK